MTTLICNCNRTLPLDADALGRAIGEQLVEHTTLCRRDAPAFQKACRSRDELVVACTQETRLFNELSTQTEDAVDLDVRPIRLLEQLRQRFPKAALVVYANQKQWDWEEDAYLLGVSHVLAKPIRAQLLNTVLDRLTTASAAATPATTASLTVADNAHSVSAQRELPASEPAAPPSTSEAPAPELVARQLRSDGRERSSSLDLTTRTR